MDKIKLVWSKFNRWHKAFLIFLIIELKVLPRGQLGFTCNDPALSHPFTGDTITCKQLFAIVLLTPLPVMLLVEKYNQTESSSKPKTRALRWYKEYLFGLLINLVIVQTIKFVVGSPRPHFFDTCSPVEATSCKGTEFVSRYTCTKTHWLSESDRSFPSGHSSLGVHAGVFIIWYLSARGSSVPYRWWWCAFTAGVAAGCALSRVWDRRHHPADVCAGATIALLVLVYTVVYLCKNFETPNKKTEVSENESNSNSIKDNSETTNSNTNMETNSIKENNEPKLIEGI